MAAAVSVATDVAPAPDIVTDPARLPAIVGPKTIATVHDAENASVPPQFAPPVGIGLMVKSPVVMG